MCDSVIDSDVADAVKKPPLLSVSTPGTKKLSDAVTLFPFLRSAAGIEQKLFDQSAVGRKLIRLKAGKREIANVVRRPGSRDDGAPDSLCAHLRESDARPTASLSPDFRHGERLIAPTRSG